MKVILMHLQRHIFKIFFNHGEGDSDEIVKLKVFLGHPQRCDLKIFFNHGEGNDNEIGQIEGHSSVSSKVNNQKCSLTVVKV